MLFFQAQDRSCSLLANLHLGKPRPGASEARGKLGLICNGSGALDRGRTSPLGPGVLRRQSGSQGRHGGRETELFQTEGLGACELFTAEGWQKGFRVWVTLVNEWHLPTGVPEFVP